MTAGTLTLRPLAHGMSGTLALHRLRIPVVAAERGETLHISGLHAAGELRGTRGEVRHCREAYALECAWADGVLTCVVSA